MKAKELQAEESAEAERIQKEQEKSEEIEKE